MAAFSNIPELSVAETLSSALGGLVGSLGGKALDTANGLEEKLLDLCKKVTNGNFDIEGEIDKINNILDTVEKTIDSLDMSLSTGEKTADALEGPLTAVDMALKVAKLVPAPVPPPVTVLISMLSELIAQIKQIVSAMKSSMGGLRQILDMIRELIERLRRILEALRAALALFAAGSNESLEDKGVENSDGTNILGEVGTAIGTDDVTLISIGGAEIIQDTSNSGDWISIVFKQSRSRPATPTSRDFQPDGWTLTEPVIDSDVTGNILGNTQTALKSIEKYQDKDTPKVTLNTGTQEEMYWWYSKATISGKTTKVNGSWSRPERYFGSGRSDNLSGLVDENTASSSVSVQNAITPEEFLEGNYGKTGAVLVLNNSNEAYAFLEGLIRIIDAAGISLEGQNRFRKVFGEQVRDKTKHYFTAPNGDRLELIVVVDPKSPNIAPLYYVTATDLRTKTVVYTGTKTFATDEEVLIKEAEVRLTRIFL